MATPNAKLGLHRATFGIITALFHDAGYIRREDDDEHKNGAEFGIRLLRLFMAGDQARQGQCHVQGVLDIVVDGIAPEIAGRLPCKQ